MRYRLRTLLLLFLFVAIFLSAALPYFRWLNLRPGIEITDGRAQPIDVERIVLRFGEDSLQELQVWKLYDDWFGLGFVWQAKVSPEVVERLKQELHLAQVRESQVPPEFWEMPRDWSDVPDWWKPRPVSVAKYYMSPTFIRHNANELRMDGIVMYDPEQQRIYVWSRLDF